MDTIIMEKKKVATAQLVSFISHFLGHHGYLLYIWRFRHIQCTTQLYIVSSNKSRRGIEIFNVYE